MVSMVCQICSELRQVRCGLLGRNGGTAVGWIRAAAAGNAAAAVELCVIAYARQLPCLLSCTSPLPTAISGSRWFTSGCHCRRGPLGRCGSCLDACPRRQAWLQGCLPAKAAPMTESVISAMEFTSTSSGRFAPTQAR